MENFKDFLTDELTDMRISARENRDFRTSDLIRNELDSRGSFAIDSKDGQVVYHLGKGYTRESVLANIRDIDLKFRR